MGVIELSIIIPTLGRLAELSALLESIMEAKKPNSYEVLVVDQNQDGLIDELCDRYEEKLKLTHYKVLFRGASKARNYGVDRARGKIVCFPDDDAEFTYDTIETALDLLKDNGYDVVFGKCVDKETHNDSVMLFKSKPQMLTLNDFEGAFVEATMFARRELFEIVKYDENLGVGTLAGSQEGYDLVYRLLKQNRKIYFSPEIIFFHPQKINSRRTATEKKRAFYYSCGLGYLCRKHGFKKKYIGRLILLNAGITAYRLIHSEKYPYYLAQKLGLCLGYNCIFEEAE